MKITIAVSLTLRYAETLNSFFQMKRFGRRPNEAWIDIFTIRGSFLMINFYSFSTIKFLSNSTNNVPLLWLHFSCLPNTAVRGCSNCSLLTKCRLTHFSFSLQKRNNKLHSWNYVHFIHTPEYSKQSPMITGSNRSLITMQHLIMRMKVCFKGFFFPSQCQSFLLMPDVDTIPVLHAYTY